MSYELGVELKQVNKDIQNLLEKYHIIKNKNEDLNKKIKTIVEQNDKLEKKRNDINSRKLELNKYVLRTNIEELNGPFGGPTRRSTHDQTQIQASGAAYGSTREPTFVGSTRELPRESVIKPTEKLTVRFADQLLEPIPDLKAPDLKALELIEKLELAKANRKK